MAISAPVRSAQYTDAYVNRAKVLAYDWGAKLRTSYGKLTFTAAGFTTAAAGDLALIRMPSGKVRIYSDLSRVVCPVGTATSDLDLGISAYYNEAGTLVALAGAALADSLDVGGGAIDAVLPLPTGGFLEVASRDGFDIVASFDTANSPAAGDLIVAVVYSIGN
jgi:hypothetical protein